LASRLEVAPTCADVAHDIGEQGQRRSVGGQSQHQGEERVEPVAQLPAVDDHVDRAFLEQKFGALEALGQLSVARSAR